MDKLVDVIADIPSILETLDTIRDHLTGDEINSWMAYSTLLSECYDVEASLRSWEKEFKGRVEAYDYTITGIPPPEPEKDEDFATVHISCMYWAVCILLYSTIRACERGLTFDHTPGQTTPGSTTSTSSHGGGLELDFFAYRIARAVPLLYNECAGTYGSIVSLFPVGVALQYLVVAESMSGIRSEERAILLDIMNKPFMGSQVGRFLRNLQRRSVKRDNMEEDVECKVEIAKIWLYGSQARTIADQQICLD